MTEDFQVENEELFEWQFENFSQAVCKRGEKFESSVIKSENLDGSQWRLKLYPNGFNDENFLSCYVNRVENSDEGPTDMDIEFEFSLIATDGEQENIRSESSVFQKDSSWGFAKFMKREKLFRNKVWLLPMDVLTLRCRLRKCQPAERQSCISTLTTRFSSEYSNPRWPIKGFRDLVSTKPASLILHCNGERKLLTVNSYSKVTSGDTNQKSDSESFLHIDIVKRLYSRPVYVFCRVYVLDNNQEYRMEKEAKHIFTKTDEEETWNFPDFIKLAEINEEFVSDNTLNLDFEITVSDGHEICSVEEDLAPLKTKCDVEEETLIKDLTVLYETMSYSDIDLLVGYQIFPAHKYFLSLRSPLFKKLFTDIDSPGITKGKAKKEVLHISNLDNKTIVLLLKFIYTDTLDDIRFDRALLLYSAAFDYQIPSLQDRCREALKSKMEPNNACEAFAVAHKHADEDLKVAALGVILRNSDSFLLSEEWKTFRETEIHLSDVVLNYLRNKIPDTNLSTKTEATTSSIGE